jgi:invasion protein IalB
MGFAMKDGAEARAEINGTAFDFVAKGSNAWVKNPAEEGQFIDAMKKGSKLIVKAPSAKGNVTTDSYSLGGLSQALDRIRKECAAL